MQAEIGVALTQIERNVALLRQLLGETSKANGNRRSPKKIAAVKVAGIPVLKENYTAAQAERAKRVIDAAFEGGVIDYDKRRGMKMTITKRTEGWSPVG